MSANVDNAMLFFINAVSELFLWALILRIILQLRRADFYNPFSQMVYQVTRIVVDPLAKFIPKYKRFDIAALLSLLVFMLLYIKLIYWLQGLSVQWVIFQYLWRKIVVMTLNLYTFSLFMQALLSWMGPGVHNPAGNILWTINEPLLRPIRRWLPTASGIDFSPLLLIFAFQILTRLIGLPGPLNW